MNITALDVAWAGLAIVTTKRAYISLDGRQNPVVNGAVKLVVGATLGLATNMICSAVIPGYENLDRSATEWVTTLVTNREMRP